MADDDKPEIAYGQSRSLTAGEIALAKSVYGSSVDFSQVRINHKHYMLGQDNYTAMTPDGNMYYPTEIYSNDFSKEGLYNRRLFIHEMAHVWQKQNGLTDPVWEGISLFVSNLGNYGASYDYQAVLGRDLLDYNMEQQADIIADMYEMNENRRGNDNTFKPIDYDKLENTVMMRGVLERLEAARRVFPGQGWVADTAARLNVHFDAEGGAHLIRIHVDEQRRQWEERRNTEANEYRLLSGVMSQFNDDPAYIKKCPIVRPPVEDSRLVTAGPKTSGMG